MTGTQKIKLQCIENKHLNHPDIFYNTFMENLFVHIGVSNTDFILFWMNLVVGKTSDVSMNKGVAVVVKSLHLRILRFGY